MAIFLKALEQIWLQKTVVIVLAGTPKSTACDSKTVTESGFKWSFLHSFWGRSFQLEDTVQGKPSAEHEARGWKTGKLLWLTQPGEKQASHRCMRQKITETLSHSNEDIHLV